MIFQIGSQKFEFPKASKELEGFTLESRPGGVLILKRKTESGSIEQKRIQFTKRGDEAFFWIDGQTYFGKLVGQSRGAGARAGSDSDLTAQFPGKVRKVFVKEGDRVEEGVPLVSLEAMKMEFSIPAPFSGTVKKVLVKEAQQISPGDRLIDLMPESERS